MFWGILRCAPGLWGLAYEFSARIGPRSPAMAGMDRIGAAGLLRHLERERPDAVVHLHPTPAGAMAWLRARGRDGRAARDRLHGLRRASAVDPRGPRALLRADRGRARGRRGPRHLARPGGHERAARGFRLHGPAGPAGAPGGARRCRRTFPSCSSPAACAGSSEASRRRARRWRRSTGRSSRIAVCGDHRRLAARLRRRHDGDARFRILDRVHDMARVMGAADLVVSKAGAMTCAEALALGRPLLLHRSLPGQERANEACLVAAGAALRARNGRELRRRLDALLGEPELRAALAAHGAEPATPGGGADRGQGDARPPGTGMTVRAGVVGGGRGRRGVGRVRLGSAVRAARRRLAARAGGETPGRAHVRRRTRSGGDAPAPAAPGRARCPGHVLPDRRARRAASGRGARDRRRGPRGRQPHLAAPERVAPSPGAPRRGRSPRARASWRTSSGGPRASTGLPGASSTRRRWRRPAGSGWSRSSGPSSTRGSARGLRPPSSATSRTASTTARSSTFTTRRGCRARPSGFWPRCPDCSTSWRRAGTPRSRWASFSPARPTPARPAVRAAPGAGARAGRARAARENSWAGSPPAP